MAAAEGRDGAQENLADGHLMQYSVRYPNFVNLLPFTFERSLNFRCRELPTSWRLRVNFSVKPEDGTVSCTIFIKRRDYRRVVVRGELWLKLFSAPLGDIPATNVIIPRMQSRYEFRRTYPGIMQDMDLRRIDERGVVVQVSFAVHGCHLDKDLKKLVIRREIRESDWPSLFLRSKI